MVTGLWYVHDPNFGSLSWFWRCKEHPCSFSPHSELWRMLEVPDWGLASWSWLDMVTGIWYNHVPNFGSLSLFLRCNEHTCPLSPDLGIRRFLTWVWHLDLDMNMITGLWYNHDPNFGSLSWFEVANNIHVLKVLIWGFGGCWRFLTGVWHFDLDFDMVTGL